MLGGCRHRAVPMRIQRQPVGEAALLGKLQKALPVTGLVRDRKFLCHAVKRSMLGLDELGDQYRMLEA